MMMQKIILELSMIIIIIIIVYSSVSGQDLTKDCSKDI